MASGVSLTPSFHQQRSRTSASGRRRVRTTKQRGTAQRGVWIQHLLARARWCSVSCVSSFLLQVWGELQQLIGVPGSVGPAAERPGFAALSGPPGVWAGPAGLPDPVLAGGPVWHWQDRSIHAHVHSTLNYFSGLYTKVLTRCLLHWALVSLSCTTRPPAVVSPPSLCCTV